MLSFSTQEKYVIKKTTVLPVVLLNIKCLLSRSYHDKFRFPFLLFQNYWMPVLLYNRGPRTMVYYSLAFVN